MSMISGQCDKLRETADEIQRIKDNNADWPWRDAFTLADTVWQMREAADTILELRDGLQQANAENAKLIVKLNAEHIVRQNVEIENAKLRDDLEFANNEWEKDSLEYLNLQAENVKLRTQLADAIESMGRVEERCAGLREFAQDMMQFFEDGDYCTTCEKAAECASEIYESDCLMHSVFKDRMRKLGAEVK